MAPGKSDFDDFTAVPLSGELTIYRSAEIKSILTEALQESDCIRVLIQDVSAMDIIALQLLCSAHRTAASESKSLILECREGGVFHETVAKAGFKRRSGCAFSPGTSCLCSGCQEPFDGNS